MPSSLAQPRVTTIQVDDVMFQADSVSVGFTTQSSLGGLPLMGSLQTHIEVVVDAHDVANFPFDVLKKLFEMSKLVTRDKIKTMKISFWSDEAQQDAICTFSFDGWISNFQIHSGNQGNHTIVMNFQPTLDEQNYHVIDIGN